MMMEKILITGSNGLLGQKIVRQLIQRNVPFVATSLGENRNPDCPQAFYSSMDITNAQEVNLVFQKHQPTTIIHTAAMTNVDQCEMDHAGCDKLNIQATQILWDAAKKIDAHFQLLSTDFVFDGKKGNYTETDQPNPLSYYGNSKYKAEQILQQDSNTNWSIARTIIVYGKGNNLSRSNIVLWAKTALEKGEDLKIVADQFRAPTWADDLAWGCLEVIRRKKTGIFHLCGPVTFSIFELVERIAKYYDYSTKCLNQISSLSLNQPAKRPPKTGFDLTKSRNELGYNPKTIEETLDLIF